MTTGEELFFLFTASIEAGVDHDSCRACGSRIIMSPSIKTVGSKNVDLAFVVEVTFLSMAVKGTSAASSLVKIALTSVRS